jgi:hypothetical protein
MRMENGSWLSLAVDVMRLTYGEQSEDVRPARGTGERMIRYTGMLAFRFFVHRGSERKRSDSMVATSEYVPVEVLIPADETEKRAGDAVRYNFTSAYRDGVEDFSAQAEVPLPEALDTDVSSSEDVLGAATSGSEVAQPLRVASGDGVVGRWPAGSAWSADQDKHGARDVPNSAAHAVGATVQAPPASTSVSSSEPDPRSGSDSKSRGGTSAGPRAEQPFASAWPAARGSGAEEPESGQEGLDLPVPVGEGFRLWGPTGDAGVAGLSAALTEAGIGSSAYVVVFRPGSVDVDQYRVRNEGGRLVWLAGSSDTEVPPPTDAIHGASFVSGSDGSPWLPRADTPEPPAESPEPPAETSAQPRVETQEPDESSWHRSQNFPRQLLRERPGALWHYVVDDNGEILLSGTAANPSGVEPGFARVAGELIWDEESRCWSINDREGWFLDEQARQELDNDPRAPHRWLRNIAHRLQEHLDIRIEPAQIPSVSSIEDEPESATVGTGEGLAAADVALPLWDSTADVEVRRLTETLQQAGPGAKALVVVFREGRDQVERYRVQNQAGRLVWMADLTDDETEPPWDAITGASFIWRPDGLPLTR